jgi:hypothetical protein
VAAAELELELAEPVSDASDADESPLPLDSPEPEPEPLLPPLVDVGVTEVTRTVVDLPIEAVMVVPTEALP